MILMFGWLLYTICSVHIYIWFIIYVCVIYLFKRNGKSENIFTLVFIQGLPHNEVVPRLKEKVMDFKQGMPVITSLRNQFLRKRHWQQIERLIGKSIGKDKSFTLGSLLEMNVSDHMVFPSYIPVTVFNWN